MWTLHKQPQHRGAQLHARERKSRQPGPENDARAPDEATRDRGAQDHDRAGETLPPGAYPASPIEHRSGDTTPTAPGDKDVEWDEVVQPEPRQERK